MTVTYSGISDGCTGKFISKKGSNVKDSNEGFKLKGSNGFKCDFFFHKISKI